MIPCRDYGNRLRPERWTPWNEVARVTRDDSCLDERKVRPVKFAVCFCIHAGELEMKALFLAASLRKHWPATIELVACVPTNPQLGGLSTAVARTLGALGVRRASVSNTKNAQFGGLSTAVARTLDALGVRLASVSNPIGADYPIANKMLCLDVPTDANRIIFLDSDILALANTAEQELDAIFGAGFVAKAADVASFDGDRFMWQSIYQACASTMPDFEVVTTTSRETIIPYFNAGVIAVDANSGFSHLWSDCAKKSIKCLVFRQSGLIWTRLRCRWQPPSLPRISSFLMKTGISRLISAPCLLFRQSSVTTIGQR